MAIYFIYYVQYTKQTRGVDSAEPFSAGTFLENINIFQQSSLLCPYNTFYCAADSCALYRRELCTTNSAFSDDGVVAAIYGNVSLCLLHFRTFNATKWYTRAKRLLRSILIHYYNDRTFELAILDDEASQSSIEHRRHLTLYSVCFSGCLTIYLSLCLTSATSFISSSSQCLALTRNV